MQQINRVKLSHLIILLVVCVSQNVAQEKAADLPKIYVAPTSDGFSNFVSSAFLENKLAVLVTTDEVSADYVAVGSGVKGNNKWYDTVFGTEKDRNVGTMRLIRVRDKVVVWADSSGDKSFWFSEFKRMGPAKVANRLARKLKGDLLALKLEANTRKPGDFCGGTAEQCNLSGIDSFGRQQYADAESAFRAAIRFAPAIAVYYHNLGTSLNSQKKLEEAESAVRVAVSLAPSELAYQRSLDAIRVNRNQ